MTGKQRNRSCVLTFRGDVPQSAYRMSVVLKALCEDDMDTGASAGDLQLWSEDGDVKVGYDNNGK